MKGNLVTALKNFLIALSVWYISCSPTHEIQKKNVLDSTKIVTASATVTVLPTASLFPTETWASSSLKSMTLREKIAQMFIIWTLTPYLPEDSENWQKILRYAQEVKVGGFYFSIGSAYAFPVNANKLQSVSTVPLLITADFEWGAGMRIDRATTFPRQMALAATRDTTLAYLMGKAIAREARALGVQQSYSPVVDVNNNPKNPVINTRSFGEDPALVRDFGNAFIRGTQEERVIATVKHFPGHGDTDIDTHLDLPSMHFTRARFDSIELLPFKSAINAGVKSVMIAHIHAAAFEQSDSVPATASENITTNLLKNELGFKGIIVTDALAMKGVTKIYNPGEAAVQVVKAGTDMLLMSPNTDEAIDSLEQAVLRGEITEERIDASVLKILQHKEWLGLNEQRYVDINAVNTVVSKKEHRDLAKEIARKSITVLGNQNGMLPLRDLNGTRVLNVVFSDFENSSANSELHQMMSGRRRMSLAIIDPRSNKMEYDEVLTKANKADMIICQFNYQMRSGQMTGFLPKEVIALMQTIAKMKKPMLGISTGNPYVCIDLPEFDAFVQSYSTSTASLEATAEVIFGEQPSRGKLPITIPGRYSYGEGVQLKALSLYAGSPAEAGMNAAKLKSIDTIVTNAIADRAFPGAVVLVARDGIVVHEKAYGTFTYDENSPALPVDAIFDLASVTKVIATTSAMMRLVEEKKVSLDDKVVKYFPQFGQNGKENITLFNLLVHNSGLPAWIKFYEFCETPQCVLDSIFATPLIFATGDSTVYSDLGLITTGKIIEKVTKTTLDRFVDSIFFKPLGMTNTLYNPPAALLNRIVPTEVDSFWKKTNIAVHGRVHDENAATLGGVSGHAGLFSTASDLSKILQMLLNGGTYGGKRYLSSNVIQQFTMRQSDRSSRGIGWDTKTSDGSFSGIYTSTNTFLHTGFTGTSVVVDPDKKTIVIFLTNRVHPTRANFKLFRVRPALHNAVFESIQ